MRLNLNILALEEQKRKPRAGQKLQVMLPGLPSRDINRIAFGELVFLLSLSFFFNFSSIF